MRLLLELYYVIAIKLYAAFFTIFAKLTMAFTIFSCIHIYQFTFELLYFCFRMIVVSDLNKYIGGSTDLAEKRHGLAHLHSPITPLQQ